MDNHLRPSGIEGLGDMSWGTHFCLFYETKQDLLDIFIPFFKVGLEHQEFCLCVVAEPLISDEIGRAMRQAFPNFEHYLAAGQIEIMLSADWYLKDERFDGDRVLQGWLNKLDQALAKGFSGVRFAASLLLEKKDWVSFSRYEAELEETLRDVQIEGLCAYNLNRQSAANVLDIMHHHQFTVARRNGIWESLEGIQLKRAHEEVLKLNAELERRVAERTAELTSTNAQLREEEQQNQKLLHNLEERVKELTTLHGWARILLEEEADILNVLRRLVFLLPPAFQYPQTTVARIQLGEKQVMTPSFEDSVFILHTEFATTDGQTASIEVGYTEDYPLEAEGPFLLEERNLINTLAEIFRSYIDRTRAEEALRASEELYRFLAENTNDLLTLYDHNGSHVYVSPSITRMLGWLPTEVFEGIHPEDLQVSKEAWQRVVAGEKTVYTFRHAHATGSWRWLETWGSLVFYRGQPHIMAVSHDVTDRKRAEDVLRKSEQVLREAESLGHTGSWEQNLVTREIFETEENRRLFFGDDPSKGANFEDFAEVVHPDDREYVMRRRAELLEEEGPSDIEYRVVWPDGSVHVIFGRATVVRDELGRAIRVYGTNVDITERKQAEEQIRQYAIQMEALAEISRTFTEAGLEYQNVLNTVARRTAELIGDSCVILLFSEDLQRAFPVAFYHPNPKAFSMMEEALLHTWRGGKGTEPLHILSAGESIYIPVVEPEAFRAQLEPAFWPYFDTFGMSSVLFEPLKAEGRGIGTLGITRDRRGLPYTRNDQTLLQNIADRAAMSIQNAQLFRQVQGAREQLEALSRRLLEVQEVERRAITTELHDRVGQNLTGLSINLQNMKALLPDATAQSLAKKFDEAQALVEDTTRQIRDIMAELHLPELEDYGLAVALETYADRAASRGNLKLVTNLSDLAAPALPSNVRIALFRSAQEAISNVLKHADATQLKVSLEEPDDMIRLSVEDNGKGLGPKFASLKETQTWGLRIMHERIESVGGNVQIKSEPGKGTRITFEVERPS